MLVTVFEVIDVVCCAVWEGVLEWLSRDGKRGGERTSHTNLESQRVKKCGKQV
jgi:hypothetical protein